MRKDVMGRIGLAAVVLLAPGGFILGASLAGAYYRKRVLEQRREREQGAADAARADAGEP